MKIESLFEGKCAQIKLDDGKRIFISILPDKVTVSKTWWVFPTKQIWQFSFPFYIRTISEAWDSSKEILDIILKAIQNIQSFDQVSHCLEISVSNLLQNYIEINGNKAKNTSIEKVGKLAIKKIVDRSLLSNAEEIMRQYGKVQEEVANDMITKYSDMVFPESLLPYPKQKIHDALNVVLQYTEDEKLRENIEYSISFLQKFIDDQGANERNAQMSKILSEK